RSVSARANASPTCGSTCGWGSVSWWSTVPRHRFEPVAFVFGAVFVAAGVIVLAGGELTEEGRALVPTGLIALGVALLVHVGRRGRPPAPAGPVATPAARVDDQDLDDLFAPVDDALADWDRANAAAGPADASAPAIPGTEATNVDATQVDITEVQATEPDGTPADPEADVTEVVDPTERYPEREPE
ncbi:MAG TPA: hypothetical protein VIX41_10005, partial [Acidimicrobiales bacterium]